MSKTIVMQAGKKRGPARASKIRYYTMYRNAFLMELHKERRMKRHERRMAKKAKHRAEWNKRHGR